MRIVLNYPIFVYFASNLDPNHDMGLYANTDCQLNNFLDRINDKKVYEYN